MGPGTSTWLASFYMFVLGTGIGLCMQVLTIAVQNTVEYTDLGTATSGVTFFRTLGSSFGTAVFGTIYTNTLTPQLADGVAEAARSSGTDPAVLMKAATSPEGLHGLPSDDRRAHRRGVRRHAPDRLPVDRAGDADRFRDRAVPQAGAAARQRPDGVHGPGRGLRDPPSSADNQRRLEAVVGKIIGGTSPDAMRRLVTESDTRLDIAGAWAVMQVELFTRMVGHASLSLIAARRRMPPEVLVPVFQRMVEEGYLTRDGTLFSHTEAGDREARVIGEALSTALAERVEQDIGRPSGADLRAAVDTIAKRLLVEDLTHDILTENRPKSLAGATTEG